MQLGDAQSSGFSALALHSSVDLGFSGEHATRVRAWNDSRLELSADGSDYIYVFDGDAELETASGAFRLQQGMYACVSAGGAVGGRGRGLCVSRLGQRASFLLGGPIEARGRLRYIDGCTDSLLLPPGICGDPCLNHLHIPAHTRQTHHTHPSLRVGIIARGRGRCVTPAGEHGLVAGLVFVIDPDRRHGFDTAEEALDVVVYHPDSDTGPTHEDHPMINRTLR